MYDEIHALVFGSVATGDAAFRPGRPFAQQEHDSSPDEVDEQAGQRDNGAQVSDHDDDDDRSEDDTQDTVHFIALFFLTLNLS